MSVVKSNDPIDPKTQDLVGIILRLSRRVRKYEPQSPIVESALRILGKHGLTPSPLR